MENKIYCGSGKEKTFQDGGFTTHQGKKKMG